mmetsp:Transcript_16964/g.28307  ORF Transcript_16964/g.28307 Transcript_16964/m.28307 type:complete len:180 (+) Transcript_16964:128-667(+)
MRRIAGPISSGGVGYDNNESVEDKTKTRQDTHTLFHMNSWLKLCQTLGIDVTSSVAMKESVENLMPCTIQSALSSDDLRIPRLMAVVQNAQLSHAGVWMLTLTDCTGEHMTALVDPVTLATFEGFGSAGTALLLENVSIFLERATLERCLNLHRLCIAACFPARDELAGNVEYEEYLGI